MKKYFLQFFVVVALISAWPAVSFADGDVMAPPSAQAESIAGVNWGTITTTDHSITITNAHLIPIVPTGGKPFCLAWGRGVPGQPNGTYEYIGQVAQILYPPYVFGLTLDEDDDIEPMTSYYFDIMEVAPQTNPDIIPQCSSLFVYGHAMTGMYADPEIDFTYLNNNTSVNVHGNIYSSTGEALMAGQIIMEIYEVPEGTTLGQEPEYYNLVGSSGLTTGGPGLVNGDGYFQNTYDNITPGAAYYLVVTNPDGLNIITPIYFEVPEAGQEQDDDDENPNPSTSNYDGGLIPCDGVQVVCDFDKLVVLINNVVDFLIVFIAFPIVGIVVAWAGILLLTSGGSSSAKEKAKSMAGHVVIGLILALLSWGIIKIILVSLGYQGPLLSIFGIN